MKNDKQKSAGDPLPEESSNKRFWVLIVGAVVVWFAWLCFAPRLMQFIDVTNYYAPDKESTGDYFSKLGQFGDLYGGLTSLVTAIAAVSAFWALDLQRKALRLTLKMQREQQREIERQAFEERFFRMLQLSRDILEGITHKQVNINSLINPDTDERVAYRALDSWANAVFRAKQWRLVNEPLEKLKELITKYEDDIYRQHPSKLGPYFRSLYQTFNFIKGADDKLISPSEKTEFSKIARGQISDGAVLLLALNGITNKGHRFVPLIEHFGLLEHMHHEYKEKVQKVLEQFYEPTAFLGSRERMKMLERTVNKQQVLTSLGLRAPTEDFYKAMSDTDE